MPSYGEVSGIGTAFERMSRRVTRKNPLAGGEVELERYFDDLRAGTDHTTSAPPNGSDAECQE
ncbi:MAG TPA: DUF479 domain-containing protein [Desulfuromonadales bacterium]|nr:DUF479 domain-containing protein [Desulfuromonadales bacterium]